MIERLHALVLRADARRLFWSLCSRFGSTVLSFAVLFAASHSLQTSEYGLYIFLFSVGTSLGLICTFGQHILLVKHFRLKDHERGKTNQALLRVNAFWLAIGCGGQLLAALLLFVSPWDLPSPYRELPVALLFGAIFTMSEYFQNYFRIHGQIVLALVPRENLWRIASAICLPAVAFAGLLSSGSAATELVTGLLFIVTGYQAVRFVQQEGLWFLREPQVAADRKTLRIWRQESANFTANGFFNSAAAYFETILIGVAIGLEAAAFYFVAYRISMLLTLPVLAIDTVGVPLISARFQEDDKVGAQKVVAMLSAGSFALALIGGIFLYFTGPFVLHLFDPAFVEHSGVLLILCLSAITHAFFGPGTWVIMIGGGERYLLFLRCVVFGFYVLLLFGLGKWLGLTGIAIAGWAQLLAVHLFSRRWVMRRWQVDNMATAILGLRRRQAAEQRAASPIAMGDGDASV